MKKIIISLLIASILIISCLKQNHPAITCEDGSTTTGTCPLPEQKDKPSAPPPVLEELKPAEIIQDITKTTEPVLKNILGNAKNEIKSMYYVYFGPENENNVYFVKDNKIKIKLMSPKKIGDRYIDTVYLDNSEKTCSGYCESKESGKCTNYNTELTIDYNTFFTRTPLDWTNSLKYAKDTNHTETIDNKPTRILEFETDKESGKMWLREIGVPMKLVANGVTYEFRDLRINTLKDSDVNHQNIEN